MKFYATSPTPQVSPDWAKLDNQSRLTQINEVLVGSKFFEAVAPTRTFDDGQIYFSFKKPIPSSMRGAFLLDLELLLKENIDSGVFIWCEPIGDKNSLRNLRGIEIVS
jgi:hypothetical protein